MAINIANNKMIPRLLLRNGNIASQTIRLAQFSTKSPVSPGPEQDVSQLSEEEKRKQAAQLAIQSLKDIGSIFSISSSDSEVKEIDTAPIFKNPKLFPSLNMLHQGQVLQELNLKLEGKWKKLTKEEKILSYYLSYGDWGAREKFENWDKLEPPYDLPFKLPTTLQTTNPTKDTIIHTVDPVNLYEIDARKGEFELKRFDSLTRFFMYLIIALTVTAVYREKKLGQQPLPEEQPFVDLDTDLVEKIESGPISVAEVAVEEVTTPVQQENPQPGRKWYYLWLK